MRAIGFDDRLHDFDVRFEPALVFPLPFTSVVDSILWGIALYLCSLSCVVRVDRSV